MEHGDLDGANVTKEELLTVLSSLITLRIRGEFRVGGDIGGLNTVVLNAVPVPSALWLLGSGLTGIVGIRRKSKK